MIVISALFLIALSLASLMVYDSGRVNNERTRLQNTADAAAYSAAVIQARELNFHAYTNRAMIANHVTVAQLVSLSSYLQNNQQIFWTFEGIADWLRYIPYIGPAIDAFFTVAERVFGYLNLGLQRAGDGLIPLQEGAVFALSYAQTLMHAATTGGMFFDVFEVIDQNDSEASAGLAGGLLTADDIRVWLNFVQKYEVERAEQAYGGSDGSTGPTCLYYNQNCDDDDGVDNERHKERMDEFRQVTLASRDQFSTTRNNRFWRINWLPFPLIKLEFRQYGGTEMGRAEGKDAPYYSWSAKDTLSMWVQKWKFSWRGPRRKWSETELGWGRQATYHPDGFDWSVPVSNDYTPPWWCNYAPYASQCQGPDLEQYWGGAHKNDDAAEKVDKRDRKTRYWEGTTDKFNGSRHNYRGRFDGIGHRKGGLGANGRFGYTGLKDFHGLATNEQTSKAVPVRIYLEKGHDKINTSNNIDDVADSTSRNTLESAQGSGLNLARVMTLSKAEAHFLRASDISGWQRRDGKFEYGSLYNPYWQPRLSSYSNSQAGDTVDDATGLDPDWRPIP
ncbi:pilus assembly protein TadG-related protein [Corallincola platygyrae]|uniref:Pilus assembly protein TadG-related protein n=1 Tax=Corallincola platygyrae TaxID=1193278 RepID=A0ABW4XQB0_9GAMM